MPLDPSAQILLDMMAAAAPPPIETLDVATARRNAVAGVAAMTSPAPEGVITDDETIVLPGGGNLKVRLYRPEAAKDAVLPVTLFLHGGGWVVGDLETHDPVCQQIALGSGAAVLAVDYRMAPEYRFPTAIEDTQDAARWLVHNAKRLRLDAGRIALCGDSAGGNLCAVLGLQSGQAGLPRFLIQVLVYPACDLAKRAPSHAQYGQGYVLPATSLEYFINAYAPDPATRLDWRASPLLAEDLSNSPSTLLYTAEYDVLHDEGEAYAERLHAAGVAVRYRDIQGHMHGFLSAGRLLPVADQVIAEISAELRRAFAS